MRNCALMRSSAVGALVYVRLCCAAVSSTHCFVLCLNGQMSWQIAMYKWTVLQWHFITIWRVHNYGNRHRHCGMFNWLALMCLSAVVFWYFLLRLVYTCLKLAQFFFLHTICLRFWNLVVSESSSSYCDLIKLSWTRNCFNR